MKRGFWKKCRAQLIADLLQCLAVLRQMPDQIGYIAETLAFEDTLSQLISLPNVPDQHWPAIAKKALHKLDEKRDWSLRAFEDALAEALKEWRAEPLSQWCVVFLLKVAASSSYHFRKLSLGATQWKIVRRSHISSWGEGEYFLSWAASSVWPEELPDCRLAAFETQWRCGVATVRARSPEEAVMTGATDIHLFRAIYQICTRKFNVKFNDEGRGALATVPAPPFWAVFNSQHRLSRKWRDPLSDPQRAEWNLDRHVTRRTKTRLRRLAQLRDNQAPLQPRVQSALETYARSLDSASWELAFLFAWATLELLSASNNYDQVCERVAALTKLRRCERTLLRAIAEQRHLLVHRGVWPCAVHSSMASVTQRLAGLMIEAFWRRMVRGLAFEQVRQRYW